MASFKADKLLSGKWLDKARSYAANPRKLKILLGQLGAYLSKDGLASVKDNLLLLYHYIKDILAGRYKDYTPSKMVFIIAVLVYVVSPFDFLPDMIPMGLLDDSSLILWAIKEVSDELEKYRKSKETLN